MENGIRYVYSSDDFETDFGIKCNMPKQDFGNGIELDAFFDLSDAQWPDQLTMRHIYSMEQLAPQLNNNSTRNVPPRGIETEVKTKWLTGDDKMFLKIIRSIIYPCNSKPTIVPKNDAILLGMIKNGIDINLSKLIVCHLNRAGLDRTLGSLPYGGFVSFIMSTWHIPSVRPDDTVHSSILCRRTWIMQRSVLWEERLVTDWEVKYLSHSDLVDFCSFPGTERLRPGNRPRSSEDEEDSEAEPVVAQDLGEGSSRPSSSIEDRLGRLETLVAEGEVRNRRRHNKVMKLLKGIAKACNCSEDDVLDTIVSSPEE